MNKLQCGILVGEKEEESYVMMQFFLFIKQESCLTERCQYYRLVLHKTVKMMNSVFFNIVP